jgi:hypothetical protein
MAKISCEVVNHPDVYYEPDVNDRKLEQIRLAKKFAPDWDQMTAGELLLAMAQNKMTFNGDVQMYVDESKCL